MTTIITPGTVSSLIAVAQYGESPKRIEIMANDNGSVNIISMRRGMALAQHVAPADAMVQVLDGSIEFVVWGQSNILTSGQFILLKKGDRHAVNAIEDTRFVLTLIKP